MDKMMDGILKVKLATHKAVVLSVFVLSFIVLAAAKTRQHEPLSTRSLNLTNEAGDIVASLSTSPTTGQPFFRMNDRDNNMRMSLRIDDTNSAQFKLLGSDPASSASIDANVTPDGNASLAVRHFLANSFVEMSVNEAGVLRIDGKGRSGGVFVHDTADGKLSLTIAGSTGSPLVTIRIGEANEPSISVYNKQSIEGVRIEFGEDGKLRSLSGDAKP
jgi:hypothetical protein